MSVQHDQVSTFKLLWRSDVVIPAFEIRLRVMSQALPQLCELLIAMPSNIRSITVHIYIINL